MSSNNEYKSDVFSMLAKITENALDVYNALNDADYTVPSMVRIFKLARSEM